MRFWENRQGFARMELSKNIAKGSNSVKCQPRWLSVNLWVYLFVFPQYVKEFIQLVKHIFIAFYRVYSPFRVHANGKLLNKLMGEQMSLSSFPLTIFSRYLKFLRICKLLEKTTQNVPNTCSLETQKFIPSCEIQRTDKSLDDITLSHLISNVVRLTVSDVTPRESALLCEKRLHTAFPKSILDSELSRQSRHGFSQYWNRLIGLRLWWLQRSKEFIEK